VTVKLCDVILAPKRSFSHHSMARTPVANAVGGRRTREVAANILVLRSDRWQVHLGVMEVGPYRKSYTVSRTVGNTVMKLWAA
jgi:hypothetical protein